MSSLVPLAISQSLPLAGRNALITGVSRRCGIGFATASRLSQLGANLCIHSWLPGDSVRATEKASEGIELLLEELRQSGTRVVHIDRDLGDRDAPREVIDRAREQLGTLDILIANHTHHDGDQTLADLTADQIDRHLAVNVRGTLLLIQAWAEQYEDARRSGRVILLTSGQHRCPMPSELAYVAGKGALHQLTASLAAGLATRLITLNTIDPGPTDTGWPTPEVYEAVLKRSPQGRWGQPDDAARLIAFLVTDDAQWITGQVIDSRGGI